MLPPNPALHLTPLRTQRGVLRLQDLIWSNPQPLSVEATAAHPRPLSLPAAQKLPRRAVRPGTAWGRLYDQRWCRIILPAAPRNARPASRWLHWDEQGEATLYVDGLPYFGFDVAHRHCELPSGAHELWLECLCVQAAIWHPDAQGLTPAGNLFRGAQLLTRHDEAWGAYHDLNCLYEWMLDLRAKEHPGVAPALNAMTAQAPLADVSPLYRRLLRGVDLALDAFESGDVAALRRGLARVYRELRDPAPLASAALTGHSHLDLVWLWPEHIGEGKAVHTFANANRLMAQYPEFRFAYSQPMSYEAVGRRAPALLAAVRQRLHSGQWEATGGMYVESDSNLPCGEGLVRTFTLGQEAFRQLSGRHSRVLWLPDLFGFAACLPQLMRLCGVDYFFTTKTTWNTTNRFPHSSFVWRGPGGHAVLSHVTQGVQFNNAVTVAQVRAATRGNYQGDLHPEVLLPTGWGDGGGGPSADMCERARRLNALRGLPALQWDQPEAFFDRLAPTRARLPIHDGEIYLEYHRGTYTTQSPVKSAFRALERALQTREAALVVTHHAPDAALDHAWQRMVFAQFHDFIPGSGIPEVYAEGLPELAHLTAQQSAAAVASLAPPPSRKPSSAAASAACVFNPLPLARTCVLDGRVVPLPPLAGVRLADAAAIAAPPVAASGRSLTNGRVTARLDRSGRLAALTIDGRAVDFSAPAELVLYPEQPANFGPWDIDRHSFSLGQPVRTPATLELDGDALVVRRRLGRASTIALRYWLEPAASVLRLTIDLDWHEEDTMLRWHLPTRYAAREMRCGGPMGSILRPQLLTHPQAEAMWETPMSRWAAVFADAETEGLFVVTEAKYGVNCRDGNLGVSLVRSPLHVGYEDHAKAYQAHLSRLPQPASRFTDQGRHVIELALGAYRAAAPRAEQPAALADTLFTPPVRYTGAPHTSAFHGLDGGDTLIPCWARPIDRDRWILRLHEVGGQRGTARLQLADGWTARKVDLLDRPLTRAALRANHLPFAPYEIISLLVARA
ncbi:alpha-mannosidase [Horticoccus luteus]|uniref:Alpha-mannosidase n=1 Tax=Horticoccus luteus TaxID=2862869 RepID=A0A8F9TX36_9BACT|nr:alpha-mannosidase [Horticoccus luteus]QYM79142.1 alpha-mannosidase [Horticoccus luteus]